MVLYSFNGWTQIVQLYLDKLGLLGKLANTNKKNFGKPKMTEKLRVISEKSLWRLSKTTQWLDSGFSTTEGVMFIGWYFIYEKDADKETDDTPFKFLLKCLSDDHWLGLN